MSQPSDLPARPLDSGSQRLEFFSDAIMAIAITLLVFNIHVVTKSPGGLPHALRELWPSYLAYGLSFGQIGVIWVSHHSMFRRIGNVDRTLLWINLMLMLCVAFLPFSTGVLAHYATKGHTADAYATMLYSLNLAAIGIAFLAMWVYLRFHLDLFLSRVDPESINRSIRISSMIPVAWFFTSGFAFVSPVTCYVIWFVVTFYIALGPATRRIPLWFAPVRTEKGDVENAG